MTKQEKIELAEAEVKQAETMLKVSLAAVKEWEDKVDLRRETLQRVKAQK